MKRSIATFGAVTALSLMAIGFAGGSALAKEAEFRNGADDPIVAPTATAAPTASATAAATTNASPRAAATATATARATTSPAPSASPELRHGQDDPAGDDHRRGGRG